MQLIWLKWARGSFIISKIWKYSHGLKCSYLTRAKFLKYSKFLKCSSANFFLNVEDGGFSQNIRLNFSTLIHSNIPASYFSREVAARQERSAEEVAAHTIRVTTCGCRPNIVWRVLPSINWLKFLVGKIWRKYSQSTVFFGWSFVNFLKNLKKIC